MTCARGLGDHFHLCVFLLMRLISVLSDAVGALAETNSYVPP